MPLGVLHRIAHYNFPVTSIIVYSTACLVSAGRLQDAWTYRHRQAPDDSTSCWCRQLHHCRTAGNAVDTGTGLVCLVPLLAL